MKRIGIGFGIVSSLLLIGFLVSAYGLPAFAPQEAKGKYQVTIDNFSFMPEDLTVAAGTTVTWVNRDDVPHTVVSTDEKFKSRALDTDEQFSFTFKDGGTYEYYCSVHPKMTAKIVVQ